MIKRNPRILLVGISVFALCTCAVAAPGVLKVDASFWQQWSDGQADVCGYELTIPRYGELRRGSAVAIFVTETFSNQQRVKVERPKQSDADHFPVMKLNLIKDFSTGIYDYNLMTSVFVALQPINGRPAGWPTKITFSSQEWCGQVYHQLIIESSRIRQQIHSYFENEADVTTKLSYPADGVSEDVLFLWARGLAGPTVEPGESITAPLLLSLQQARLDHRELTWRTATFNRTNRTRSLTVPAGTFETQRLTVSLDGEPLWEFDVQVSPPQHLIQWRHRNGETGRLLKGQRLKYWTMNNSGSEQALEQIGLSPRPPRTP